MTGWPSAPVIYEVNTAVWLTALSRRDGKALTLGDVADEEWDDLCRQGVDAIWLMGVWERSPAGRAIAMANDELVSSFRAVLPDLDENDVFGSPYCVRRYAVDPAFGGADGLAAARRALAARGRRLVLDYVPNHVAPDHPWVIAHPERLVRGTADDLAGDPAGWLQAGANIVARARDPYFPPWPDVVQLDAFATDLRAATIDTLSDIAAQCDGIRCDMAMLVVNSVFGRTWSGRTGAEPSEDFWPEVLAAFHRLHPHTVMIAEVYWDMEAELLQQGFDFCYDKRIYDRLMGLSSTDGVGPVRDHLRAEPQYQARLLRFLENHDEARVAARLSREVERAVAVCIATLPGATLWHEGQFEGRRVRPPVFLNRRPDEVGDLELSRWYDDLLGAVTTRALRSGSFRLLDVAGWRNNDRFRSLLAWTWSGADDAGHSLVVVNLSDQWAQGLVPLTWTGLSGHDVLLQDAFEDVAFLRDGDELYDPGLYVDLAPWQFHVLIRQDAT